MPKTEWSQNATPLQPSGQEGGVFCWYHKDQACCLLIVVGFSLHHGQLGVFHQSKIHVTSGSNKVSLYFRITLENLLLISHSENTEDFRSVTGGERKGEGVSTWIQRFPLEFGAGSACLCMIIHTCTEGERTPVAEGRFLSKQLLS